MKNMREIIALMESPVIDTEHTEMQGSMDIRGLLQLLPGVSEPERFKSAMRKIMSDDIDSINRQEAMQLAYAFVSVVRADQATGAKIAAKLRQVHGETSAEA